MSISLSKTVMILFRCVGPKIRIRSRGETPKVSDKQKDGIGTFEHLRPWERK